MRLISPASTPDRLDLERGVAALSDWGLVPEFGRHAFDVHGHYLAGRDENRTADLNEAFRDPKVRAVISTTGGKGAYRVVSGLDYDAMARDPKPFVGFSESTIIHLARWKYAGLAGIHGPNLAWVDGYHGPATEESMRRALMEPAAITIKQGPAELTAELGVEGVATGVLMGGNLDMIRTALGWACPDFAGTILLIEAVDMFIGAIDRTLTQLLESGLLDQVAGVAVGQFIRSGEPKAGKWSALDVLRDRLIPLGVPVLGGLPIGHGPNQLSIPLGTLATIDTAAGTLTIAPAII